MSSKEYIRRPTDIYNIHKEAMMKSLDRLIEKETYYINETKSFDRSCGYNVMLPVDGRLTHSPDTRQKIRDARLRQGVLLHTPAKLFEHEGESKSAKDWAEHFGINYTTFRQNLREGKSVAEASQTKPKELRVEFDGEVLNLKEVAKKTGIHYKCLWSRMQSGVSIEEALSKTSLKAIARQNNINYSTFSGRISRGMSVEEALAKPVRRRKRVALR